MQLGWSDENSPFYIDKHRINNTGWMMKWQWNGGVERKAPIDERMLNVFDLHFPTPAVEATSRIYACRTERNLQIFGWCLQFKQSCPWATLSYFCLQNKAEKTNATRRVVSRKCIKRAQRYQFVLNAKKSLCKWNSLHCRQKTTTSLWNLERKGNWRKRKCGHRLIMHS